MTVKLQNFSARTPKRANSWTRWGLALTMVSTSLVACVSLSGCGGSNNPSAGATTSATQSQVGRATFAVRWPERSSTRLIPFAAESIKVQLVREGALLGEAVLTCPANGGEAVATFERLPPGDVTVQATAYPTATGDGVGQARAEVTVTVQAGQTTPTRLTLASTIDRLEITPALTALTLGQKVRVAATALNANGEVVITNLATLQWSSSLPNIADVAADGLITGITDGQATITVRDSESGKSASLNLSVGTVQTPQPGVVTLNANDLVYSPKTGRLYASLGSTSANGNSIAIINPANGAVEKTTFLGSEPGPLAISDDGNYIYAGLNGAAKVCRYNIPQDKKDLEFTVGNSSFSGSYYAEQIAVMPGNPNTVAVSKRNQGYSPRHEGVTIYDSGVARANSTPGHTGSNRIEWASPTRIYGYNNETTGFNYFRLTVSGTGVAVQDDFDSFDGDLISGFGVELEYDAGRIFTTSGRMIDAENRVLLGSFAGRGPVATDMAHHLVFFATSGNPFGSVVGKIEAYDTNTFLKVAEVTVTGATGSARRLIRYGDRGIALATSDSKVYYFPVAPGL